MSRSLKQFQGCLKQGACKKSWFSALARTETRNVAATGESQEQSQCRQDLSGDSAIFQACRWLHTPLRSLAADETSKSAEYTTEKASGCKEKADMDTHSRSFPPGPRNPVSWLSFLLMLVTGAGLIAYYDVEKKRRVKAAEQATTGLMPESGGGKAAIGGRFKLINHEGTPITDEHFKGNWTLVYFGFTHCPDICPDELQKMVEAIDIIEKRDSLQITPVFISVDPERDTVEQMHEYVRGQHAFLYHVKCALHAICDYSGNFNSNGVMLSCFVHSWWLLPAKKEPFIIAISNAHNYVTTPNSSLYNQRVCILQKFHPRLIGLTGSLDEIKEVTRGYRVYYMKTGEEGMDYLVDHSIIMYLMDPKMEFVKFFGRNYDVKGLADGIIAEIKGYKS